MWKKLIFIMCLTGRYHAVLSVLAVGQPHLIVP